MGDRYKVTARVDAGGMAEVFRGVAESLQGFRKNVAIKRILPSLTKNEKFVSMFLDEAKLSLYLQHANIVQVFDIGVTENSYFLVMEFVDGCNLKSMLEYVHKAGRRIEIPQAIYLMIECCKALNYAHHLESPDTNEPLRIVHRDISPPNILISKMGEVKLVDFGLAKASSQLEATDPGVVKGKFSYLSPEAASGREVDNRADIFAIGILLWEMLTGRRLFYGDTDYQTVELVRQARVPSASALNTQIEAELEDIVRKALSRDPAQRYQEAADLGDALAQYLFSRRMKVTARDVAALVRDIRGSTPSGTQRTADGSSSLIDELIQEEMARITSLVDEEETPSRVDAQGSASLNPSLFVDTSEWISDFGLAAPDAPPKGPANSAHAAGSPAQEIPARPAAPVPPAVAAPPPPAQVAQAQSDVHALADVLDHDSVHVVVRPPAHEKMTTTVLLLVVVLLLGGLGATLFVFKDQLFG